MRNIRLDICYDGTRYRGWQRLPGKENTIQGKLETVLSRILQESVTVSGSGRTDAGTHAMGQVANFHCENDMAAQQMLALLKQFLPEDIGVLSCKDVSPRFHARLNAKEKTYRYRIWNSDLPCVFERRYVYIFPNKLDLAAMQSGAQAFLGRHDFSAFCVNPGKKKSTERFIRQFEIETHEHEIWFTVTGNGFLHHMVRIMVGTLLEVGRGERSPNSISELFGEGRKKAGPLIPSCGLCLMEVKY